MLFYVVYGGLGASGLWVFIKIPAGGLVYMNGERFSKRFQCQAVKRISKGFQCKFDKGLGFWGGCWGFDKVWGLGNQGEQMLF